MLCLKSFFLHRLQYTQLSAQNEQNAQNSQISDEKSRLADRWAAYESDASILRQQTNALQIERQHLFEESVSEGAYSNF